MFRFSALILTVVTLGVAIPQAFQPAIQAWVAA